jgi:hypothetical protein
MPKSSRTKITPVRAHPMRVPVSKKNPTGITIRDRHLRRLKGTYLDHAEIESVFRKYDRTIIARPTYGKLEDYGNADHFDELIAIWIGPLQRSSFGKIQERIWASQKEVAWPVFLSF